MTLNAEYRRILTRMGYYNYQNGLIYRNLQQEGGWDEHNRRCREYIIKAAERICPDRITVLGSGWLLDFPLVEILEKKISVFLVDIVHPPEVISQVSGMDKVTVVSADITGGLINEVWNITRHSYFFRRLNNLDSLSIPDPELGFDPGMIVSLNILTQLEILPVNLLKNKASICDEALVQFRKTIQDKHLRFLCKNNSVLISDREEIHKDNNGNVRVVPTLLQPVMPGMFREEWTWNFDLKGSDYYTSKSIMKVIAETFSHE